MHWKVRQGCVLLSGLLSDALLGVAVGCVLERLMCFKAQKILTIFYQGVFCGSSLTWKCQKAQIEGLKVKVLPEKWSNPVRLSQTHPSDDPATCTHQNSTMSYYNSLSRALYEYNLSRAYIDFR